MQPNLERGSARPSVKPSPLGLATPPSRQSILAPCSYPRARAGRLLTGRLPCEAALFGAAGCGLIVQPCAGAVRKAPSAACRGVPRIPPRRQL